MVCKDCGWTGDIGELVPQHGEDFGNELCPDCGSMEAEEAEKPHRDAERRCIWCLKRNIDKPVWEQKVVGTDQYAPLCPQCLRKRFNNPYNALLPMRKIQANLTTPPNGVNYGQDREHDGCGGRMHGRYCNF